MSKKYKRYTKEQIEYLREIADGTKRSNKEITEMFNKKFNQKRTRSSLVNLKSKNNIHSYTARWTKEHIKYLREISANKTREEIVRLFNEKFNENRSNNSMKYILKKNNISLSNDGKFERGDRPSNTYPIGTEMVRKDDYTYIKVSDDVWRPKHRYLWEKHNGEIPKNYVVIFADNDRRNFDIDNLILMSRSQMTRMGWAFDRVNDIEMTKTMLNIVKLEESIEKIIKKGD